MITVADAIQALDVDNNKTTEFCAYGDPTNETEYISQVKYVDGVTNGQATFKDTPVYTWKEISDKKTALKTDYDSKEYQRKREPEYLHVKEQIDKLYHDMTAGKLDATGEWHKTIKAVKDKYPK